MNVKASTKNATKIPPERLRAINDSIRRYNVKLAREDMEGRGGLIKFVRYFWHVLEPAKKPWVDGWAMEAICEHLEAVAFGDINRLLMVVPPGFCKALDCDTPVMTTHGWKRHGDLRPGDFVFGPDGQPKRVLGCTPHVVEKSYEVEFDDGVKITAGHGHLWEVERDTTSEKGRRERKKVVVTTPELVASVPHAKKSAIRPDRIPLAEPVQMPPKRLLIDPYLLGAWLGDGASGGARLFVGHEDIEHFKSLGRITRTIPAVGKHKPFYHVGVPELQTKLRILDLLNNKHVPEDYLEASVDQRWELLRGLMDTDGSASKEGHCSYSTKIEPLADSVMILMSSLGMKPCKSHRYQMVNGKKCGPYFMITFTPPSGAIVFNLARKQDRLRGNMNARSRGRYVSSVRNVGERIVNCICVEGSLYLAGKSFVITHNSLLTDVFFPAWLWSAAGLPEARIVAFSYAASLTERDNGKFRDLIISPEFQEMWGEKFRLRKIGEKKVTNNMTGWKLATSVGGVGTGERGNIVILDDPHSIKQVESEDVRNETVRWFREAMSNRLNDMESDAIIVIMQRSHDLDVAGVILDPESGMEYCVLSIPMEYDPNRQTAGIPNEVGWTDPREYDGELAFPERFSEQVCIKLQSTIGPYAWAAQYQQNPVPRGGGIIKRNFWQLWDDIEAHRYGLEWTGLRKEFPEFELVIGSVDTAYGAKEENNHSAMTVWGLWLDRNKNIRIMLMFGWKKRLPLHGVEVARLEDETVEEWKLRRQRGWGLVEWVADTAKRYRVNRLLIEDKTKGIDVANEIKRLYKRDNWGVQLLPVGRVDKVSRAHAVVPIFTDGAVYAPNTKWADIVMTDCERFPKGADKDLVDTVTQALNWIRGNGLLPRADEMSASLQDEATFRTHGGTVAQAYGV